MEGTVSTLAEDIESLGRTANVIADQRNALIKLVRSAVANNPRDYVAWREWIDEAQATLRSLA